MCCQGPVAWWHVRYCQLRWFGHVVRMSPDRWPSQILFGRPPDSRRPQTLDRHESEVTSLDGLTISTTTSHALAFLRMTPYPFAILWRIGAVGGS